MSKFLTSMILAMVCTAHALTEAEFEALYKRTDKDADACYKLYQAYRDGDGVEKNETCARKWLLGAHMNGMPVYNEIANLPWRKKAKLKPGRQLTPRFSQETIQEKNKELKMVVMANFRPRNSQPTASIAILNTRMNADIGIFVK